MVIIHDDSVAASSVNNDESNKNNKRHALGNHANVGRSKGYGFVEFTEHAHSLAALRVLNNNPQFSELAAGGPASKKVQSDRRSRLIVQYAVENTAKLRLQAARKEISMKKQNSLCDNKSNMTRGSKDLAVSKVVKRQIYEVSDKTSPIQRGDKKRKMDNGGGKKRKREGDKIPRPHETSAKMDNTQNPVTQSPKDSKRSNNSQNQKPVNGSADGENYRSLVEKFKEEMLQEAREKVEKEAPNAKRKRWFEV